MPITVPRFKRRYHTATIPGTGTFLLTETLPTVLNGELNNLVCPLIDGVRSADEIAAALAGRAAAAEVYYTINVLEQRGYIEEAASTVPDAEAAFWQACDVDPETAARRLAANPVEVCAVGEVTGDAFVAALAEAGIRTETGARLRVVVADDYRRQELAQFDAEARARQVPWALVKPIGTIVWLGPFLDPRHGGCWHCLVDRIRLNYPVDTFLQERDPAGLPPLTSRAWLASTVGVAANLLATEVAKWIVRRGESPLVNSLITLSTATLTLERHVLTPRPQCPSCGDLTYRTGSTVSAEPVPIAFVSRPITHRNAGGHRTASPGETLERFAAHVSPITGVVSRLERVSPPGNPVIHAYAASHNWATHPDSLAFLRQSLRSQSGGKGKSDEQARVGAMAEAFERYSGVFRGDEIRRRATMRDMGEAAIHPTSVMLFSESQYARRGEINAQGNSFQMVPNPFDESLPTDWSPMWAPSRRAFRWVPTGLLYYSYSKVVPHETPNRLAFYADSNGCASGNSLEEATLQALLELAERDAVATWWYNRVRRPAVALDDIDDPYLIELRRWLDEVGRDLWVVDITNDIGIPVFAAFSRRLDPAPEGEQLVVGFGAHLEPAIGIMRAITEVNQFFASLFALGERDLGKAFDPGAVEWWRTATRANKPYVVPAADLPVRRLRDFPDLTAPDLRDEVQTAIDLIEARGLEVLLLDQTRPDVRFPVVKALAPGMRHFWARLAPGRLYDVPVQLGWLSAPLAESELNPTPVFF